MASNCYSVKGILFFQHSLYKGFSIRHFLLTTANRTLLLNNSTPTRKSHSVYSVTILYTILVHTLLQFSISE